MAPLLDWLLQVHLHSNWHKEIERKTKTVLINNYNYIHPSGFKLAWHRTISSAKSKRSSVRFWVIVTIWTYSKRGFLDFNIRTEKGTQGNDGKFLLRTSLTKSPKRPIIPSFITIENFLYHISMKPSRRLLRRWVLFVPKAESKQLDHKTIDLTNSSGLVLWNFKNWDLEMLISLCLKHKSFGLIFTDRE